jgi:hypothetical protein
MSSRGKVALAVMALIMKAGIAMAEDDNPSNRKDDNRGNKGIITYGQQGNNYIIYEKMPPSVKVVEEVASGRLDDGAFSVRTLIRLTTHHPPNAMVVAVKKQDVVMFGDLRPMGIEVTRAGGMTHLESGHTDEFYWAKVHAPTAGDYVISIRAKELDPKPRLQIDFL